MVSLVAGRRFDSFQGLQHSGERRAGPRVDERLEIARAAGGAHHGLLELAVAPGKLVEADEDSFVVDRLLLRGVGDARGGEEGVGQGVGGVVVPVAAAGGCNQRNTEHAQRQNGESSPHVALPAAAPGVQR